jgi:hypothetical protein
MIGLHLPKREVQPIENLRPHDPSTIDPITNCPRDDVNVKIKKVVVRTFHHSPRKSEFEHPNYLRLNPPCQKQNKHNDNHQTQAATWVISPRPAVRPRR